MGCCSSDWTRVGWTFVRKVGWLNGGRRMEASFEFFERTMGRLTGPRTKASSGARYEDYWTQGLGFAGQMLNCSACLGPFRRWDREH